MTRLLFLLAAVLLVLPLRAEPASPDKTPATPAKVPKDKKPHAETPSGQAALHRDEPQPGASSSSPEGLPPGFGFVIPKNTCESGTAIQQLRSKLK